MEFFYFFFAFSFSCHENRRRAHVRVAGRRRAGREDGKVSGGRVKGKVRAAGQDRNRDWDKGRVEGWGRRFLSLMLQLSPFSDDPLASAAVAAGW